MDDFRIAHIFDDDKFIDMAISLFESVYAGKSDYYVIQKSDLPFRYVRSPLAKKIVLGTPEQQSQFIESISRSGVASVFFHALNGKKQQIAIGLPKNLVKVWFIWGYDLYSNWKLFGRKLFEKSTYSYVTKGQKIFYLKQRALLNPFVFRLFLKSRSNKIWLPAKLKTILKSYYAGPFYKAAKTIDVVVPVIPTEYELVRKMNIAPRFATFNYGSLESLLGARAKEDVLTKRDILVGNSADPSNNHLEIFEKIAGINLGNRKVYVPLSYGGDENYKEFIVRQGYQKLGDNFVPLTEFMTAERYNEILLRCGFLIFNHTRQQGVGNIITLGALGAKVFLNEKSTVFSFYRERGIIIFSTNRLNAKDLEENLSKENWQQNKRIYSDLYSENSIAQKAKQLLQIVKEEIDHKKNDAKSRIHNNSGI